jgi:hypothetical protein
MGYRQAKRRPRRRTLSLQAVLRAGGRGRIDLLKHCVRSVTMEPVFVYLVQEYRQRPRHATALALFDMFCAPGAPGRLHASPVLPPVNLVFAAAVEMLRAQSLQAQAGAPAPRIVPNTAPMRGLFDRIVEAVTRDPEGRWARLALYYNTALDPSENLPGKAMTQAQRHFIENVWKPRMRPCLVNAGFWQLLTIE